MVQDVGYRPYIMKEIIKRERVNGIADNYKLPKEIAKELRDLLEGKINIERQENRKQIIVYLYT